LSDKKIDLGLTAYDDLFESDQSREENNGEKVVSLPLSEIDDFNNHPFKVIMDDSMAETADSIKKYGVLVPALVRPKENGRYEMVAGHRRKKGCELAELSNIPCIVRNLSDDEATIIMVDTNLQREHILPSEKAFAYKMKLEAMKRQAGRPSKENSSQVGTHLRSDEQLANEVGESRNQIQRYIRLTNLIPEVLQMVDDNKIALNPAVELSYLSNEQQRELFGLMDADEKTPSLAQAKKMKQFAQEENLNDKVILSIMCEEKPNQKEQIKIPKQSIEKFFKTGTPAEQIENDIVSGLELLHRQRQRERNRDAR